MSEMANCFWLAGSMLCMPEEAPVDNLAARECVYNTYYHLVPTTRERRAVVEAEGLTNQFIEILEQHGPQAMLDWIARADPDNDTMTSRVAMECLK